MPWLLGYAHPWNALAVGIPTPSEMPWLSDAHTPLESNEGSTCLECHGCRMHPPLGLPTDRCLHPVRACAAQLAQHLRHDGRPHHRPLAQPRAQPVAQALRPGGPHRLVQPQEPRLVVRRLAAAAEAAQALVGPGARAAQVDLDRRPLQPDGLRDRVHA
eukprot:5404374-Prymnesium_polylepis.1